MSQNGIFNEHYKSENTIEPWDFMAEVDENAFCKFLIGNVLKYLFRAGKKQNEDKIKDIKKASAYLDELIDHGVKYASFNQHSNEATALWLHQSNPLIQNLVPLDMSTIKMRERIRLYIASQK